MKRTEVRFIMKKYDSGNPPYQVIGGDVTMDKIDWTCVSSHQTYQAAVTAAERLAKRRSPFFFWAEGDVILCAIIGVQKRNRLLGWKTIKWIRPPSLRRTRALLHRKMKEVEARKKGKSDDLPRVLERWKRLDRPASRNK